MAAVYPVSAGIPTFSDKMNPTIWSQKLVKELYKSTLFGEICNRDYEGEIKNQGDKVVIRSLPEVIIRDYVLGSGFIPDSPTPVSQELLIDKGKVFAFNVLDLQKLIRSIPKPVIAMVAGYAIGGGHVLHVVCDLTIAADNARFGQTGPKVGSFDGGFGASYLARIVGQKKAREMWYLCEQYDANEALQMGLVNKVVPLLKLEEETLKWCEIIKKRS